MDTQKIILLKKLQKNELTEYRIYNKIAKRVSNTHNKNVLERVAKDEYQHYTYLKEITGIDIKPSRIKIFFYYCISLTLGLTFGLKLMEKGEAIASQVYKKLSNEFEGMEALSQDEQKHEKDMLNLLSEERLDYAGFLVLGLNDALVELTGALAGLTFALQNSRLVALAGLITGFAASLSMAASGYLSSKESARPNDSGKPLRSALYTGTAYMITVVLLIVPFFVIANIYISLLLTLIVAILIIFLYTFYITTAKDLKFWQRFIEMAVISLSIALISFGVGLLLKKFLGVDA